MLNHLREMWKHYLILILIVAVLYFPAAWIYRLVDRDLGRGAALLALTITVMSILMIAIGGARHTHNICCALRGHLAAQEDRRKPMVLQMLSIDLPGSQVATELKEEVSYEELLSISRKRRGKQSRFSQDQIWKAVLKWEKRDAFFGARTLEEFLEDEFGSSPDGILQVAPSTFYDWRRHVIKEIRERQDHSNP